VESQKNYGIVQLGREWWIVADIIATTDTRNAAWQALGHGARGCVIETAPGQWAACRARSSRATRYSCGPFDTAKGATFESTCRDLDDENHRITLALKDLLMRGDARFERGLDGEQWFAVELQPQVKNGPQNRVRINN
jgi:hypothetical protein